MSKDSNRKRSLIENSIYVFKPNETFIKYMSKISTMKIGELLSSIRF
jgi:hypothetical protein